MLEGGDREGHGPKTVRSATEGEEKDYIPFVWRISKFLKFRNS